MSSLPQTGEGTSNESNVENLPTAISYVIDESVQNYEKLEFKKCFYIAIGVSHETGGGPPPKRNNNIFTETIGKFSAEVISNQLPPGRSYNHALRTRRH